MFKDKLPKNASMIMSGALLAATLVMNYATSRTHMADEVKQLQADVNTLKTQMANDVATRRELNDFKTDATARLDRIENKVDQELEFHRNGGDTVVYKYKSK